MKSRSLVTGLLILVIVQSGLVLFFIRRVHQMRDEMTEFEKQVAQLRLWRDSMQAQSANGEPVGGGPLKARGRMKGLAQLLAELVIVEHGRALPLDRGQLQRIQQAIALYDKRNERLQPMQRELDDMWSHLGIFTPAQEKFIQAHQEQVASKAEELLKVLHYEDDSLVYMLDDFVRESRANI